MKQQPLMKRGMAILLSVLMLLGAVPQTAFASESVVPEASIESVIEEAEKDEAEVKGQESEDSKIPDTDTDSDITKEAPEEKQAQKDASSEKTGNTKPAEKADPAADKNAETKNTTKAAAPENAEAEEKAQTEEPLFTSIAEGSSLSAEQLAEIDFSSKRLIVAGPDSLIIDKEDVLSSYEGIYLLQYDSAERARNAYSYYYDRAEFVDVDSVVAIATGNKGANGSAEMTEGSTPIDELAEAVAENPHQFSGTVVALIDTGVNGNENVVESVSMLGDDTSDANGHGTRMAELICAQNPDVRIISIKALGADGTGDMSAIFAAIQYAKEKGADIINLSVSALKTAENAALANAVAEAQAAGIKVVASAGNKGKNAAYYVPASLDGVITIGAANEDGTRLATSNYGDVVEYNVVADSTSEAAAIYSGLLSAGKGGADEVLVFPTNYQPAGKETVWVHHQVSFFDAAQGYEDGANRMIDGSALGTVGGEIESEIKNGYIQTSVLYDDADKGSVHDVHVYLDFMNPELEKDITEKCEIDYQTGLVRIPAEYKDAKLTVRWYQSSNSTAYYNLLGKEFAMVEVPAKFAVDWLDVSVWTTHEQPEYNYALQQISRNTFTIKDGKLGGVVFEKINVGTKIAHGAVSVHYEGDNVPDPVRLSVNVPGVGTVYATCGGSNMINADNWTAPSGYLQCVEINRTTRTAVFYHNTDKSAYGQDTASFVKITFPKTKVKLKAKKMSGNTNVSNGNACFKYDGIKFNVYAKNDRNSKVLATLTTNTSGVTGTVELDPGTYYVGEVKSSLTGKGWTYNSNLVKVTLKEGDTATVTAVMWNKPAYDPIGILVQKVDENGNKVQYPASLAGAEFTVQYYDGYYKTRAAAEASGKPTKACVLRTDSNGFIDFGSANEEPYFVSGDKFNKNGAGVCIVPSGTVIVRETKAPSGYVLNPSVWAITLKTDEGGSGDSIVRTIYKDGVQVSNYMVQENQGGTSALIKQTEPQIRGGVKFLKIDATSADGKPQDDRTLAGAKITIYAAENVYDNAGGKSYKQGDAVLTLTTDANGNASTAANALTPGKYYALETEAPNGYAVNKTWKPEFTIGGGSNNVIVDMTKSPLKEYPLTGGVKFAKVDAETKKNSPQGAATLEGAEITIYYNGDKSIKIGDKEITKDQAVVTITTDKNGIAETAENALPYGEYYAVETSASTGYRLNSKWRAEFVIDGSQRVIDLTGEPLNETVKRGDINFKKEDLDGRKMSYIPFMVSLLDTKGNVIESHVVVTDADGNLDTSLLAKTGDTVNSLDQYVENGTFTDESKLKQAGVWFGAQSARSDSKGALVYGNYRITELRCKANAGTEMLEQDLFSVSDTNGLNKLFENGKSHGLDEVFMDMLIRLESDLVDEATQGKSTSIGEKVVVSDTVSYDRLRTYNTYKMETVIVYVSRDKKVTEELGSKSTEFKPEKVDDTDISKGTLTNSVTINTQGRDGGSIHAIDRLYVKSGDEWNLLTTHNEELNVKSQVLGAPFIETRACDAKTNDNVGAVEKEAEIKDIVTYGNLSNGKEYRFVGTLRYADTGEIVKGTDGKDCVVEYVATVDAKATEANGSVIPAKGDITMPAFKFDASEMKNKTLVVTEVLYDNETGTELIDHSDLADKKQSVNYITVETQASDKETGTRTSKVGEKTVIVDKVTMENTIKGLKYTVKGDLVYTKDCTDANGKEHKKGEVIATHEPVEVTAESDTTVVYLEYEVDASALEGQSGVVFEEVYHNDVEIAKHHDYEAIPQIPQWPKVRTSAVDGETKTHTGVVNEKATVEDTVSLTNLVVGDTYKVKGTLMYSDGTAVMVDGQPLTVESEAFKADAADMTISIIFEFDSSKLEHRRVVVFEKLFCIKGSAETEVAHHEDLEDKDQTVDYPEIHTNASDGKTKDQVGTIGKEETIIDTVTYKHLKIGEEYTIHGDLHYKEAFTDINGKEHKAGDVVMNGEEPITASATFTAEKEEGTIDLVYTVNSELLRGTSVVVFEDLEYKGVDVYAHNDLKDEKQRVDYPDVHTTATDSISKDHVGTVGNTTIIDTVALTDLTIGKKYTVEGTLIDKATGKELLDKDGKPITAKSEEFEATAKEMTIDIEFEFERDVMEGITTVAFEDLLHNGIVVSYHRDIEDEGQSVHYPKIRTTAIADKTEDHIAHLDGEVTITDTISYENLPTDGRSYTMTGTLVDAENGSPIQIDGEPLTASTVFTPEEMNGTVDVTFKLDASLLPGTKLVAFEELTLNQEKEEGEEEGKEPIEVAEHKDVEDEGQTVYVPEVKTKAIDEKTLINHSLAEKEVKVKDTVSYKDLLPGKEYTVKGYLVDKKTGEPIEIDGKKVEAEKTFTAEAAEGTVEMEFVFDATSIIGAPIVVFETLYYKDVEVAVHADITDEEQTDYIPKIGTTAIAGDTKEHVTAADKEVVIIDTVAYEGLKPNSKYEVKGTLMDKKTGKALKDASGKPIVSATTFVTGDAEEGEVRVNGTVDVTFKFDGSNLAGTTSVVFETLYHEGKEVAVHADINDVEQTIEFPEIKTTAKDKATGDHDGHLAEKVEIVDEVRYTNLIPGKTYSITGKLMVKETGKELLVNGKPVTATKEFSPEKASGSVELTFAIDSRSLEGKTIVVFEDLKQGKITVATHADINDKDQSVRFPKIRTKAADKKTGSQKMSLGDRVVLVDTVSYSGLTPGKQYVLKGTVMDKATGRSTGTTAEARFTPKSADGVTTLEFTLNTNNLKGKTLVVFEKLYDTKGNLIAEHEDLNDKDQTVTVPTTPPSTPRTVKTGDDSNIALWLSMLIFSMVIALGFVLYTRKRKMQK